MKIALAAANGRLARLILRHLQDRGVKPADLIAVARTPSKCDDLAAAGVTVREASYDDEDAMRAALEGADRVMLVSGMAPPELRKEQHRKVINSTKAAGASRVVFTSFLDADDDSPFFAREINKDTEAALVESGLEHMVLRNGMYADADLEYVDEYVKAGEVANNIGPDGRISYISRDDLALGAACALLDDKPNQVLELTGPRAYTQVELAQHISRWKGVKLRYRAMSDEDYAATFPDAHWAEVIVNLYKSVREGRCAKVTGDFQALTGQPSCDLDESWLRFSSSSS